MLRKLPEQNPRMESGPVQFGDDYPGLWLRGDHACPMGFMLAEFLKNPKNNSILKIQLEGFAKFLQSCDIRNLGGEDDQL